MYENPAIKSNAIQNDLFEISDNQAWWKAEANKEKFKTNHTRATVDLRADFMHDQREKYERINTLKDEIKRLNKRVAYLESCYTRMRNRHYRYVNRIIQLPYDERGRIENFFKIGDVMVLDRVE